MRAFPTVFILAAAFASAPAMAQDSDDNGGVFIGAVAGLDVANIDGPFGDSAEEGFVYGLTAGYDLDMGDALIGVEVEVAETTIDSTGVDIYGGVRLGLEMDDNDIIYLKAGYTNVDIEVFDNLEGFRIGAGVELSFGAVALRGEYRYSGYNASDGFGPGFDSNRHQFVLTLGGKF